MSNGIVFRKLEEKVLNLHVFVSSYVSNVWHVPKANLEHSGVWSYYLITLHLRQEKLV